MEVHVEQLSPVLVEFQIKVPAEQVTLEVEASYDRLKRTARVRGFRKGKAPRKILAQLYGPSIRADVAQRLMDSSLASALRDKALEPLTRPSVEPSELSAKEPFAFKARFEVRPEVDKVKWEGLVATRPAVESTDKEVDKAIEQLQIEHATMQPVEKRAAKAGDFVTIGLGFTIEGKARTEDIDAQLGKQELLSEVDEGVLGLKPGEKKSITASFPADHPVAALRGTSQSFDIDLKELKERILPAVDNEFAKDCDHDDLKSLRHALKEDALKKAKERAEEAVARALVAQLCEKNPIAVPPSLVEKQSQMSERELRAMARMTGQPIDEARFGDALRADAEIKVRAGLLMAEIAKLKSVKVTDDDMDEGYAELAQQSGKNVAKIKAEYREKSKRDMLIGMILEDKVLDLLRHAAKITDKT